MKLVKEHIEFQRGLDPKDAMNVGIYKPQNFNSAEEFAKYLFDNFEIFFKITPSHDLAGMNSNYYRSDIWKLINQYFKNCLHTIDGKSVNDTYNMTYWDRINKKLNKLLKDLKT